MAEMLTKTTERSPYMLVCLQECERMNRLLAEIRKSLDELDLGLKVQSTVTHTDNTTLLYQQRRVASLIMIPLCPGRPHHLLKYGDSAVLTVQRFCPRLLGQTFFSLD